MNKPLAHSYSALKQYDTCPRQYEKQRITREVKASFGEASIYGNRIHEQLEKRINDGVELPEESKYYEHLIEAFASLPGELVAEKELVLTAKLEPTTWWAEDAWLRSKLDVLVINGHDAVVADWKTGKRRPDSFQMELFAIQVLKHYPEVERVRTALIWLKTSELDQYLYTRLDAPALWDMFYKKVLRIEESLAKDNWPPQPSGLCPWCPAKNICEFG